MAFVPFVETDQPTMAAFNEKFQQNYEAAVSACAKIESGTYVGSGDGTKSLTFGFVPKLVVIYGSKSGSTEGNAVTCALVPCYGLTSSLQGYSFLTTGMYGLMSTSGCYASLSGKTLTLGQQSDVAMNISGVTYRYTAIA